MADRNTLNEDSSAVQSHLNIMQGVIERMAENSRACKLWCITLVSASLVFVARAENPDHALIALLPTVLFLVLDIYYLALERAFRGSYTVFVRKLHHDELALSDIYTVAPTGSIPGHFIRCLMSFSIWPFYPVLLAMILVAWRFMT